MLNQIIDTSEFIFINTIKEREKRLKEQKAELRQKFINLIIIGNLIESQTPGV